MIPHFIVRSRGLLFFFCQICQDVDFGCFCRRRIFVKAFQAVLELHLDIIIMSSPLTINNQELSTNIWMMIQVLVLLMSFIQFRPLVTQLIRVIAFIFIQISPVFHFSFMNIKMFYPPKSFINIVRPQPASLQFYCRSNCGIKTDLQTFVLFVVKMCCLYCLATYIPISLVLLNPPHQQAV